MQMRPAGSQRKEIEHGPDSSSCGNRRRRDLFGVILLGALFFITPARAADFAALCADRAALERVYHSHRLGTKPDFDQAMLRELIERFVRLDLKKEAVLKKTTVWKSRPR
jgi:hypothetical protein